VSGLRIGTTPGRQFSASFFGFPELGRQNERPIIGRAALILFVLALSGFAVAVLLRRLAFRERGGGDASDEVGTTIPASFSQ
jgi:hypothetical protein